jgi:hypothetical protein
MKFYEFSAKIMFVFGIILNEEKREGTWTSSSGTYILHCAPFCTADP